VARKSIDPADGLITGLVGPWALEKHERLRKYIKTIAAKPRPRGENVVDLMDALKRSIGQAERATPAKCRKPRKAAAGRKEMLLPIAGKKPAKEAAAKKTTSKPQRKSA
jgi:DNA end-binding protein Ku